MESDLNEKHFVLSLYEKNMYLPMPDSSLPYLQAYAASSWKETRTVVFTPAGSEKTHLLQPDQSISETVTFGQSGIPTRKFLRVIGGVKMPAPFQNRGEEMFRPVRVYIDDNLDW